MENKDQLQLGDYFFNSRLLVGTGKYENHHIMKKSIEASNTEMVTMALRRVDLKNPGENVLNFIPKNMTLLPNTSGARNAAEAIRIARIARAAGCGDFIKIEVISDQKYLLPDNYETIKATKVLAAEGFHVLPYMSPDLMAAKEMEKAGAKAVMPLGSPIGSNRGIENKGLIKILINEIKVPIIVDAGIGKPSHAAEAMELGAKAVLVNTAIAASKDPVGMARAFDYGVKAGRLAYLSKFGAVKSRGDASSPLTGFLRKEQ